MSGISRPSSRMSNPCDRAETPVFPCSLQNLSESMMLRVLAKVANLELKKRILQSWFEDKSPSSMGVRIITPSSMPGNLPTSASLLNLDKELNN